MSRYRSPEEELAAIDDMLRYGRLSVPATLILLAIGVFWSVHIAVIAIAASALAVQAGILIYAGLRRRKLTRRRPGA
jgi:hypothetical protein